MDFLTDWLTNWLKELLISGIMGNLEAVSYTHLNMKAILALADTFDDHQRTAFQQQVKERFFHGRCLKSTHLCYYPQN